jgi:CrcB protein
MITPQLRLLFMTGFLGGLTTFSTYALESVNLWTGSEITAALANIAVNNLGGFVSVLFGLWLGNQM